MSLRGAVVRSLGLGCVLLACARGHRKPTEADSVRADGGSAGIGEMGSGAAGAGLGGNGDGAPAEAGSGALPLGRTRRQVLNFNLDWRYHRRNAEGAEAADYDDSEWTYVDLPHTTKFVSPEDPNADLGVSWYRKHFSVPAGARAGKASIEFGAAMQLAEVWVNGVSKARHEGGYTPFTIDITDDVSYSDEDDTERPNVIAVKMNNNANASWAPGRNGVDFQYHGGLYRDVTMLLTSRLHVTDAVHANRVASGGVFVRYPEVSASSATLDIGTHVINESRVARDASVETKLVDADGDVIASTSSTESIAAGQDVQFSQQLTVDEPRLWHPYTPNLYTLETTVLEGETQVDAVTTRIGIRRVEWTRADGLVLNGTRLKALGVNLHQETYGLGNAVPARAIYYDVKRVKDAGLDFIRGAHYPHAPAFYDACDELGVLVLNAQTGWQHFSDTEAFKNSTYQELRDMLRRDRNHPSVVAWEASLNESEFTTEWAKQANAIVHEEYPGDQAYSAAWRGRSADIFAGASQHSVRDSRDSRPTLIDEYGDWDYGEASSTSRQAREADDEALLTQADNVEEGTAKNLALSWYSAGSYWHFADYAGFTSYGITRPGLVDMYRLPKFAYYFFKSQRDPDVVIDGVDSGPMVYIANRWTPDSPTTVRVYSNCEDVSLYLNDDLVEALSRDSETSLPHAPVRFEVGAFTAGTLRADCLIEGEVAASVTRRTPETAAALLLRPEAKTLFADASDARLVFIEVVDEHGTVVPTDTSKVTLEVEGPASVVGPTEVTMRGGQLATWIRGTRVAGKIAVTARAEGLDSDSLELTSKAVADLPPAPEDRGGE